MLTVTVALQSELIKWIIKISNFSINTLRSIYHYYMCYAHYNVSELGLSAAILDSSPTFF